MTYGAELRGTLGFEHQANLWFKEFYATNQSFQLLAAAAHYCALSLLHGVVATSNRYSVNGIPVDIPSFVIFRLTAPNYCWESMQKCGVITLKQQVGASLRMNENPLAYRHPTLLHALEWLPEAKVSEIRSVKGAKVLGTRVLSINGTVNRRKLSSFLDKVHSSRFSRWRKVDLGT
jgi:hypothetical protein